MNCKIATIFFVFLTSIGTAQNKDIDYFINQGLQNSPLLKDYQLQIQTNGIDSQRLRVSYLPQVNAGTAAAYAPVIKGWGYDGAITNLHTFNALMTVSQPIIGKDNINNQYRTLQLQNLGLQNQGKISEQDLKRSIVQQYIAVYGDLEQIRFNTELMDLLKEEESILKKLAEKGVYKQTDFLSFMVSIQQQELVIKQLHQQYQNNFSTLNYICGLSDTAYTILPAPQLLTDGLPPLEQTVFFQQYQLDSLKIKNTDQQIDFNYQPKINVYADGGYYSSFLITPYKNFGLSAGISLVVPIYDGNQKKMLHQKNTIAEQNRQNYLNFFSKQYKQQIAQLQQQLVLAEQLIQQATIQTKYAEGLIKAQRKQLVTGDVTITEYIIAIGNYLNAKNIITQNTINKLQLINQINYWNRKQ